mmetsp:Transcript_8546/g.21626  ORF Transcript_8546/g.21626 Transcript_8546/m.21626 type:complete len:210 (+) Transcript_8546:188-817(+)
MDGEAGIDLGVRTAAGSTGGTGWAGFRGGCTGSAAFTAEAQGGVLSPLLLPFLSDSTAGSSGATDATAGDAVFVVACGAARPAASADMLASAFSAAAFTASAACAAAFAAYASILACFLAASRAFSINDVFSASSVFSSFSSSSKFWIRILPAHSGAGPRVAQCGVGIAAAGAAMARSSVGFSDCRSASNDFLTRLGDRQRSRCPASTA